MQRRRFLQYIGASTVTCALPLPMLRAEATTQAAFLLPFQSPPYPLPLPGDGGDATSDKERFAFYSIPDELLIPPEYIAESIVSWGERLGAIGHEIRIGYNCDHLSLIRRAGSRDEYYLVINHEYVSVRPWTESAPSITGVSIPPLRARARSEDEGLVLQSRDMLIRLDGGMDLHKYPELAKEIRVLANLILSEVGVSIVHLKREGKRFIPIRDSKHHKRISACERENIPTDVPFSFRGPGVLGTPRGTLANCSGATTPWGTALSCEENIQTVVCEWVTPTGHPLSASRFKLGFVKPDRETGLPLEWTGLGTCLKEPLNPLHYGWVCEVVPETGELKKYTSLGRFRHENVALDVRPGRPLRAYMGDDRRGGHIWRYESRASVQDPNESKTSTLLEDGILSVAQFSENFTGRWIPLTPSTKLSFPKPERCATNYLLLPSRPNGGPIVVSRKRADELQSPLRYPLMSPEQWVQSIEQFTRKPFHEITLGDLVQPSEGMPRELILLLDAFLMANACGGTPSARPEDLEVHPFDSSIYVAFTDASSDSDGSPDTDIFPDSKGTNSRQYGALYRIEELTDGVRFQWGKFLSSGEVADGGANIAALDNLAFDREANLYFACDISPELLNHPVNRTGATAPGKKYFPGIFGNSSLFVVPTRGDRAGIPKLFAVGPLESELTGLKFYEDESTPEMLLLAVQHPGEDSGVGRGRSEERTYTIRSRSGEQFTQRRKVPLGSTFPHDASGVPRPTVYFLRRK